MKKLLVSVSLVASMALPSIAHAQAIPPAVVAVVEVDRVRTTCNACKTAIAALQSQQAAADNRLNAQAGPLQTEQQSIQAAVNALNGKQPDAALQARAKAWQTKADQLQQDVERARQQLGANQQYVVKQIDDKMNPIFAQVMQRRGANVLVDQRATLATASAVDVTNDVLTALNAALTTIQTVAPAPARPNQPQGR